MTRIHDTLFVLNKNNELIATIAVDTDFATTDREESERLTYDYLIDYPPKDFPTGVVVRWRFDSKL